MIGFAVNPETAGGLEPRGNESWSERLKAKLLVVSPAKIGVSTESLMLAAWTRS